MLAVDFSPASERTVRECAGRDWPAGTIVCVLGVVERLAPSAAELWYDAAGSLQAVWQTRHERVEKLVRQVAVMLENTGLTTETLVQTGRRRKIIARAAKSWSADVVIDAARGLPKTVTDDHSRDI
jgi:nucleotide-binding universal stress UspA family protein